MNHRLTEFKDRDLNKIYVTLKSKERIKITHEDLRRLIEGKLAAPYNPITNYFNSLKAWDGVDHIKKLVNTINFKSPKEKIIFEKVFRKWIIATVACAMSDTETNHTAIILQGMQGIGKTRWLLKLVPTALLDYIYTGNILPNNKDSQLAVVQNFLINLDELETLNRTEIGFLKSIMTQKDFDLRKPYGHYSERFIRRSSFMGSVNKLDFINDLTGSRRFLCFSVNEINYNHNINMDKVFVHALFLYDSGEPYWFTKEEGDMITSQNEKFTFHSIEEEKILESFKPTSKDDPEGKYMNSTEIAEDLYFDQKIDNGMIRRIGSIMLKHNFKRKTKNGTKKWILKRK